MMKYAANEENKQIWNPEQAYLEVNPLWFIDDMLKMIMQYDDAEYC